MRATGYTSVTPVHCTFAVGGGRLWATKRLRKREKAWRNLHHMWAELTPRERPRQPRLRAPIALVGRVAICKCDAIGGTLEAEHQATQGQGGPLLKAVEGTATGRADGPAASVRLAREAKSVNASSQPMDVRKPSAKIHGTFTTGLSRL